MQNGVSSDVYEGKRKAKKSEKELEKGEKKKRKRRRRKREEKKMRRDSQDPGGSALSHFEGGFPKVLR